MNEQEYIFKIIELAISIIATIGTIIGLILVAKQLKDGREQIKLNTKALEISNKSLEVNLQYQQREKAVELSKYFEEILDTNTLIIELLSLTPLKEKIQKLELNNIEKNLFNDFDIEELKEIFPDYDKNKVEYNYYELINKLSLEKITNAYQFFRPNKYYDEIQLCSSRNFKPYSKLDIENGKNEIEKNNMKIFNFKLLYLRKDIIADIFSLLSTNLNKLEYFSMNFISDIGEDEIIYPSLHQVFFAYVEISYIYIASKNKATIKDKYYTNIIKLYIKWKKRYLEELKKEKEAKEEAKQKSNTRKETKKLL